EVVIATKVFYPWREGPNEGRRARRGNRAKAWGAPRAGRPRLDVAEASCHRADRWRDQAAPPGRRRRRVIPEVNARRDRGAGGALRSTPGGRVRLIVQRGHAGAARQPERPRATSDQPHTRITRIIKEARR